MKSAAILLISLSAVLLAGQLSHAVAQDGALNGAFDESEPGQRLSLNVFLDATGKALVTGYAEDADGLDFLNKSDFRYENDTQQLYALTDRLTEKSGDLWTLNFSVHGSFNDYRVTFYLPKETSLGEINASSGLSFLLSASNESIVADMQGYDVSNPQITIQYRQPLAGNSAGMPPAPPLGSLPLPEGFGLVLVIIAAALLVSGFALGVIILKRQAGRQNRAAEVPMPPHGPDSPVVAGQGGQNLHGPQEAAMQPAQVATPEATGMDVLPEGAEDAADPGTYAAAAAPGTFEDDRILEETAGPAGGASQDIDQDVSTQTGAGTARLQGAGAAIAISSEMEAVMQTLTPRERAVISTLIDHGGRMTQAEIRYETGTPKSSLTGILISLERRKLVTKKEWGRTNIIELSEWFLSKKERS
jgi:uncharacterized membrane protein